MFQRRVLKIFKILIKCFIISSCICNSTTEKSCYRDCICQSTQQYAITLGFKRFHCQNCSRPEEMIFSCTVFQINQSIFAYQYICQRPRLLTMIQDVKIYVKSNQASSLLYRRSRCAQSHHININAVFNDVTIKVDVNEGQKRITIITLSYTLSLRSVTITTESRTNRCA